MLKKFDIRTYPMFKKTQVTILIATLTMQVQSMENAKPTDVIFDGRRTTNNSFFNFYQSKKSFKNEYRIDKICLRKNIPANSVVNLIIPARTKDGRQVVLDKKACAGWNNPNIKINLYFVATERLKTNKHKGRNKLRVRYKRNFDYVKIVSDKTEFFKDSASLLHCDMSGIDNKPAKYSKGNEKKNKNFMTSMFDGCSNVKSIKWGKFYPRKVTRMDYMFRGCAKLENLNLKLNTAQVRTMKGMFADCGALENLEMLVSGTSKLQNMDGMFKGCKSLPYVDLKKFDMQSVQTMQGTFGGCEQIESIEWSKNAKAPSLPNANMKGIFKDCFLLKSLIFDTKDPKQNIIPSAEIPYFIGELQGTKEAIFLNKLAVKFNAKLVNCY